MSPPLATEILDFAFENDKDMYRLALSAVAEAKRVRPVFMERKSRAERNKEIIAMLGMPRMEMAAANLLRGWLLRKHKQMLIDFLDGLGVKHKEGVVDDLPKTVVDAKLKASVENLLTKYKPEEVSVYLNAFQSMNDASWENLKQMLESDARLQLGGA
ncbi:MAG: hypothetical protein JWM68_5319 [Verrucomicrobiales bacterium]|nr:hypothetical protein [Verrucomicrobiales bacterium]